MRGNRIKQQANQQSKVITFKEYRHTPCLRMLLPLDVLTIDLILVSGLLTTGFEFGASGQAKPTKSSVHTGLHSFSLSKFFHHTTSQPRTEVFILILLM